MKITLNLPTNRSFTHVAAKLALVAVAEQLAADPALFMAAANVGSMRGSVEIEYIGAVGFFINFPAMIEPPPQPNPPPQVTRRGALDMQVCVPATYTDEEVEQYANDAHLCGTTGGWRIVRAGDRHLAGAAERVVCEDRLGCVHVMVCA